MNFEELMEYLEIESPEEFEYFENFADLVEADNDISEEAVYRLFSQAQENVVTEIMENYFEELMNSIPDESTDVYTLVETIRMALKGLYQSKDEENVLVHFCEELINFRNWYCKESEVECRSITDGHVQTLPLRDALALARLEKLQEDEYHYDFNNCLDYEIEEYILSYSDLARSYDDHENDYFEESYDDIDDIN